jgi:hypothetical protein
MKNTPRRNQPHQLWVVWMAVFVAVLGAIAPTVSHALVLANGPTQQGFEVCTSQGSRWVIADLDGSTDNSDPMQLPAAALDHCPFCLQSTDRVALINAPLTYPFLVQDGEREPPLWQAFFHSAERTFAPPPRGPPGCS